MMKSKFHSPTSSKSPYEISQELLANIHFSPFVPYAERVIDVLCSKYHSLSLSPHTIAFYSISILMKKYYGMNNAREPLPQQQVSPREHYLCLNLISHSFKQLRSVCHLILASGCDSLAENNHYNGKGRKAVVSPKNHFWNM